MTYEQKYGRSPDGFYQEEAPPEDWQFENPLVTVSKDGEVKNRLSQVFVRPKAEPPKMRPISEILNKEVEEMEFIKLDMDKQIKLVAEEHNRGAGPSEVRRKLGIKGAGTYYDRLDKARAIGLITKERVTGGASRPVRTQKLGEQDIPANAIKGEMIVPPKATVEDFAKGASEKLELAEKLAKEAERLQQAGKIALEIDKLLGDKAGRVVTALYAEVSA